MKDGFRVPVIQRGFAGGGHTAIKSCQQQVLTAAETLVPFRDMAVNDGNNVEFGGEIPQCRQGAEFDDSCLHRLSATFLGDDGGDFRRCPDA